MIRNPSRIEALDEGVSAGLVDQLDFVGAGVTATVSGRKATVTIPGGGGGGGGAANVGTAVLDFGTFPGVSDASVLVTGQAGIIAGSVVLVQLRPEATADHTADEHLVENMRVTAGAIVPGTGFTIYGVNTSEINEPALVRSNEGQGSFGAAAAVAWKAIPGASVMNNGGKGTRIWGLWNVAWMWG